MIEKSNLNYQTSAQVKPKSILKKKNSFTEQFNKDQVHLRGRIDQVLLECKKSKYIQKKIRKEDIRQSDSFTDISQLDQSSFIVNLDNHDIKTKSNKSKSIIQSSKSDSKEFNFNLNKQGGKVDNLNKANNSNNKHHLNQTVSLNNSKKIKEEERNRDDKSPQRRLLIEKNSQSKSNERQFNNYSYKGMEKSPISSTKNSIKNQIQDLKHKNSIGQKLNSTQNLEDNKYVHVDSRTKSDKRMNKGQSISDISNVSSNNVMDKSLIKKNSTLFGKKINSIVEKRSKDITKDKPINRISSTNNLNMTQKPYSTKATPTNNNFNKTTLQSNNSEKIISNLRGTKSQSKSRSNSNLSKTQSSIDVSNSQYNNLDKSIRDESINMSTQLKKNVINDISNTSLTNKQAKKECNNSIDEVQILNHINTNENTQKVLNLTSKIKTEERFNKFSTQNVKKIDQNKDNNTISNIQRKPIHGESESSIKINKDHLSNTFKPATKVQSYKSLNTKDINDKLNKTQAIKTLPSRKSNNNSLNLNLKTGTTKEIITTKPRQSDKSPIDKRSSNPNNTKKIIEPRKISLSQAQSNSSLTTQNLPSKQPIIKSSKEREFAKVTSTSNKQSKDIDIDMSNAFYKSLYEKIKTDILQDMRQSTNQSNKNSTRFSQRVQMQSPKRCIPKLDLDHMPQGAISSEKALNHIKSIRDSIQSQNLSTGKSDKFARDLMLVIDTLMPAGSTVEDMRESVDIKSINDHHQTLISTMKDKYRDNAAKYQLIKKIMWVFKGIGHNEGGNGNDMGMFNGTMNYNYTSKVDNPLFDNDFKFSAEKQNNNLKVIETNPSSESSNPNDTAMIYSNEKQFKDLNESMNLSQSHFTYPGEKVNKTTDLNQNHFSIPNDISAVLKMSKERKYKLRNSNNSFVSENNISKDSDNALIDEMKNVVKQNRISEIKNNDEQDLGIKTTHSHSNTHIDQQLINKNIDDLNSSKQVSVDTSSKPKQDVEKYERTVQAKIEKEIASQKEDMNLSFEKLNDSIKSIKSLEFQDTALNDCNEDTDVKLSIDQNDSGIKYESFSNNPFKSNNNRFIHSSGNETRQQDLEKNDTHNKNKKLNKIKEVTKIEPIKTKLVNTIKINTLRSSSSNNKENDSIRSSIGNQSDHFTGSEHKDINKAIEHNSQSKSANQPKTIEFSDAKSSEQSIGLEKFHKDLKKIANEDLTFTKQISNASTKPGKTSHRQTECDDGSEDIGSDFKYKDYYSLDSKSNSKSKQKNISNSGSNQYSDSDRNSKTKSNQQSKSNSEQQHFEDTGEIELNLGQQHISNTLLACEKLLNTFNPSATAEVENKVGSSDKDLSLQHQTLGLSPESDHQWLHQDKASSDKKNHKVETPKFEEMAYSSGKDYSRNPLEEMSQQTCNNITNTESFYSAKSSFLRDEKEVGKKSFNMMKTLKQNNKAKGILGKQ